MVDTIEIPPQIGSQDTTPLVSPSTTETLASPTSGLSSDTSVFSTPEASPCTSKRARTGHRTYWNDPPSDGYTPEDDEPGDQTPTNATHMDSVGESDQESTPV